MGETFIVEVTMNQETREQAEAILREMGVSVPVVIRMLYSQIIAHDGLPFDVRMPKGIDESMSKEEEDAVSLMTLNDLRNGNAIPFEDFAARICGKYNIPREELLGNKN
ncbi:MAG: type II toxin-antitoxin system RelB/DinJ family antitoxin [Clostridia bacterium]|nr:type II toxin-antitoxin system RelB/DinJ family antitoxin [Clostridia bacterium]